MNTLSYITEPLMIEEIKSKMNGNYIEEINVAVSLEDLISSYDYCSFLDLLSEKILGNGCLQEIDEKIIGCDKDKELIIFSVSGDVSSLFEEI